MSQILCWLLPFLAGLFLGWLICGWFARRLKHSTQQPQKIIEKKVEVQKIVDNPDHLALITKLKSENANFAKLAATSEAAAQTGIFLADQYIKGKAKKQAKHSELEIKQAAVLGAGIMGGGIAYQSAYKGTPIIMKDINQDALDLGMGEASKLLGKKVQRGHMAMDKMVATLGKIKPTLNDADLQSADIVVEAVVENPKVKQAVLAGLEKDLPAGTILTSNTSTIRIDELASALEKPENFCGMHFFNPVPKMPLVEIIRGEKTSEA